MPELRSDVLDQVIVGFGPLRDAKSFAAARAEVQSLLAALEEKSRASKFEFAVLDYFVMPPTATIGWTATAVLEIQARSVTEFLTQDKPGFVAYWERNSVITPCAQPNDPQFARGQWGLQRIGSLESWATVVNSPVTVAIVDSGLMWRWDAGANGVSGTHEDLDARPAPVPPPPFPPSLWVNPGEAPPANGLDDDGDYFVDDFNGARVVGKAPAGMYGDGEIGDEQGHGTMLAGIMFATTNNGLGLASPLSPFWPGIKLMTLKFFDADTRPKPANAKQAIVYAVDRGARIINLSWHVGPGNSGLRPIQEAVDYARQAGALVVCAAGNDGSNNDRYPTYPANLGARPDGTVLYDNVIAVHATDRRDHKPSFSNYGPRTVHLGAPGVRIATTRRHVHATPSYGGMSGTSASAAFVSIAAAMVLAVETHRNRALTPAELIRHLVATADVVPQLRRCSLSGARLNLANAINTPFPVVQRASASD